MKCEARSPSRRLPSLGTLSRRQTGEVRCIKRRKQHLRGVVTRLLCVYTVSDPCNYVC
jgi:hypothetical protein